MQEQDIPIDIHTGKLLDWMLSRKVCSKDWQNNILVIREKINNAIQDMPIHAGITKLVSGSYINYFHCKKIIEILKDTEAGSKNFFGSYGSQRMKDWVEIVHLYEKNNVYLAEAAQILIRNVNFEVPSLKKEILHCSSVITECEKKDKARIKSINTARHEFDALCKTLAIKGNDIKPELVERTKELADIYSRVAKSAKSLESSIAFYTEFVKFMAGGEHKGGCLPTVKYIIAHGNTTVYEWSTGRAPPPLQVTETLKASNDTSSDNGIDLEVDEINFDDIEYDISTDAIDFGDETATVELISDGSTEKCSPEQYASLLDSNDTRNAFIDELKELEAFLKVRQYEMKYSSDLLTLTQMQDAPTLVQLQTTESLAEMMDSVETVLAQMTNPVTNHLHNIKHSPRYVDNLTNTLKQKLVMIDKMSALQSDLAQKQAETVQRSIDLQPKLKLIIEKTKQLQTEIEQEISKLYKNRPVNIMGGINAM